jgi:type I restriction enzyme M protein
VFVRTPARLDGGSQNTARSFLRGVISLSMTIIRRELLKQADAHTLLRLPIGIFYAQGVKANVLFFDRKPAAEKPWTSKLWIYDLRTNKHFTLKESPLKREDLDDFVACYNPKDRHERKETERFKAFTS